MMEGTAPLDLAAVERAIVGDALTSDETHRTVLALCDDVGTRFGGSEGERQAAELIRRKMDEQGLENVRLEELSYTGWRRGPASLEVIAPRNAPIRVISLPYSPTADVVAEVVSVGQGEEEDFAQLAGDLAGKIVLCQAETTAAPGKRSSHRREKYARAVEAGCFGFLYVSQNPGQQLVTGSLSAAQPAEIPAVAVSLEDGADLSRALDRGPVRVRLRVESSFAPVVSYNVVGDVPGTDPSRHVVVGGHYDSHDIAPGAADNAAGVAVALEVGRLLSPVKRRLPTTVRIVAFAGEEIGLLGSWEYVRRHAAELGSALFMLNLDSPADGRPGTEALHLMGSDDLKGYFATLAAALKYPLAVESKGTVYTDHFPFLVSGVPVARLLTTEKAGGLVGRGWGHTASDTVDKVRLLPMQTVAMLAARVVLRIAADATWPGSRRTEEQIQRAVEAEGVAEYLRRHGKYPFQP